MPAKKKVSEEVEVKEETAVEAPVKKTRAKKVEVEEVKAEEVKEETAIETPAKKTRAKKVKAEEVKEEEAVANVPAKKTSAKKVKVAKDTTVQYLGTGRRKKSVARVRLLNGTGKFIINDRDIDEFFGIENLKVVAKQPLTFIQKNDAFDVYVNVVGGGFTGQAGAIRLGVARALIKFDENLKKTLKDAGFLTRDARIKERKKYGKKKARKSSQFSKR